MTDNDSPFSTIESVQGFLSLLSQQIDEASTEARAELAVCSDGPQQRRAEAWQVVLYTLTKLSAHVASSRRLVNDLRTLRNLMYRTSDVEQSDSARMSVPTTVG
jgi:hypothetical protein